VEASWLGGGSWWQWEEGLAALGLGASGAGIRGERLQGKRRAASWAGAGAGAGDSGYRGGQRWEEGLAALGVAVERRSLAGGRVGHGIFFLRRRVEAQQE